MSVNLKGRNFLTLKDFTKEEISYLLDLSADLKGQEETWRVRHDQLVSAGTLHLIFEKTSTQNPLLL